MCGNAVLMGEGKDAIPDKSPNRAVSEVHVQRLNESFRLLQLQSGDRNTRAYLPPSCHCLLLPTPSPCTSSPVQPPGEPRSWSALNPQPTRSKRFLWVEPTTPLSKRFSLV